jgi:c-di-GMP-related signal transduction protein
VRDYPTLLPNDRVVIEILQSIGPHNEVIATCSRFKTAGCMIALDDFRVAP